MTLSTPSLCFKLLLLLIGQSLIDKPCWVRVKKHVTKGVWAVGIRRIRMTTISHSIQAAARFFQKPAVPVRHFDLIDPFDFHPL